jgi:1-acyl-sn-glycerol-3-phosphate acyltransferase
MIDFLRTIYYWFVVGLVAILSFLFYPCRVYGRENIPKKGGCIFASNHESNIDPMLLPTVSPRQMRFMAKEELFRNPVMGWVIRTGGGFPIRRSSADRSALNEFLHQLELGYPVLIFPQGTRGGTKIQGGVGFLAATSGVPVVPIFVQGTDKVLPKGAKFPKRTPVTVTFGKPFKMPSGMPSQEAAEKVMAAILALKPRTQG